MADSTTTAEQEAPDKLKRQFQPGEQAPHWYSTFANLDTSTDDGKNLSIALKDLCQTISVNRDIAARRWEVEEAWLLRLMDRGYQKVTRRKGGGWDIPGFQQSTYAQSTFRGGNHQDSLMNLTNVYSPCAAILKAALTRDIPNVRFEPENPMDDGDITAKDGADKFARIFKQNNDLLGLHAQIADYACNDERIVIVTDFVLDAQRFGWMNSQDSVVPETETQAENALLLLIQHGEEGDQSEDAIQKAAGFLKTRGVKTLVASAHPQAQLAAKQISEHLGVPFETNEGINATPEASTDQLGSSGIEGESPFQHSLFELLLKAKQTPGVAPIGIIAGGPEVAGAHQIFAGQEPQEPSQSGSIQAVTEAQGGGYDVNPVLGQQSPQGETQIRRQPRGQEVAEAFGKLEAQITPMTAKTLSQATCISVDGEYDLWLAKAMFPDKADDIQGGGSGSAENQLDRIARININLAIEPKWNTADSLIRDVTISRKWLRPAAFWGIENEESRDLAFDSFPDGALVVMAGNEFIFARNECMDDHITLLHVSSGSGQNRRSLMAPMSSIQRRLNNWADLFDMYFRRCVQKIVRDKEVFNADAMRNQDNIPGNDILVVTPPGQRPLQDYMAMEPMPTTQPTMMDIFNLFFNEVTQFISGAVASLFGGESNQDTATGTAIQRDQALARLGTPWHAIQVATCSYFRQAVQLAARCRPMICPGSITSSIPGEGVVSVELSELKGNVLAFPAEDANLPENWNQRQARLKELLADSKNPFIQAMLVDPKNAKFASDALGLRDFKVPGQAEYDKQLGEFKVLLKTPPVPNPEKVQGQQILEQAQQGLQPPSGVVPDPQQMQQIQTQVQQATQKVAAMPDQISTVKVLPTDNDDVEMVACADLINGDIGRKLKNGNEDERGAFQNVMLHYQEHQAQSQKKKLEAAKLTPFPKPPNVTIDPSKLPGPEGAAVLTKSGVPATPDSMQSTQEGVSISG